MGPVQRRTGLRLVVTFGRDSYKYKINKEAM